MGGSKLGTLQALWSVGKLGHTLHVHLQQDLQREGPGSMHVRFALNMLDTCGRSLVVEGPHGQYVYIGRCDCGPGHGRGHVLFAAGGRADCKMDPCWGGAPQFAQALDCSIAQCRPPSRRAARALCRHRFVATSSAWIVFFFRGALLQRFDWHLRPSGWCRLKYPPVRFSVGAPTPDRHPHQ